MALTRRQKEVLDFIADFIAENGYSPSFDEIAGGMGLASVATVHKHISALESKNYLIKSYNQSRSLELGRKYFTERRRMEAGIAQAAAAGTPLMGTIAAGRPIESYPQPESLSFAEFAGKKNVYALEVRGDSMIDDHIMEGDYVLVEQTDRVRDGDIVVALVEGTESTLKRFYREAGDRARLQPANAAMEPIFVPLGDLQIQGRVLAVHRRYN